MRYCDIENCGRKHYAKGLCTPHYYRKRDTGTDLLAPLQGRRNQAPFCIESECEQPTHSFGLCSTHYAQRRRAGKLPVHNVLGRTTARPLCKVSDCNEPHAAKGYCSLHYNRWLKHGSADEGTPKRITAVRGSGHITKDGYRTVHRPRHPSAAKSGAIPEHRLAVSDYLRRPLTKVEQVHHRNGDRLDNSVGECLTKSQCECSVRHNLELWSRSQPAGQRVHDKIQWAKEILALYVH